MKGSQWLVSPYLGFISGGGKLGGGWLTSHDSFVRSGSFGKKNILGGENGLSQTLGFLEIFKGPYIFL